MVESFAIHRHKESSICFDVQSSFLDKSPELRIVLIYASPLLLDCLEGIYGLVFTSYIAEVFSKYGFEASKGVVRAKSMFFSCADVLLFPQLGISLRE